jgi:hypothetical protein
MARVRSTLSALDAYRELPPRSATMLTFSPSSTES